MKMGIVKKVAQNDHITKIIFSKVTNHSILHYLWSVDLSKSFSQLIMPIFMFTKNFFQQILKSINILKKCRVTPHFLHHDLLTLNISFGSLEGFINNFSQKICNFFTFWHNFSSPQVKRKSIIMTRIAFFRLKMLPSSD